MRRRALAVMASLGLALGLTLGLAASVSARNINAQNSYTVARLVSDQAGVATFQDPNLVNGWGITAGPTTPWWVSDNGTDLSTLYTGGGNPVSVVVNVAGAPTGTVFNGDASAFLLATGGASRFLFATESGTVLGWNPAQGTAPGTAVEKGNRHDGAVYKGLAIGSTGGASYLYATDFHNGRVDVYDSTFGDPNWTNAFVDPGIPAGFAPFGIQNLNGTIYVTYAKQDADARDEIDGEGLGFVSAFGTDGSFIGRVASRGALDAPWGLAWAPATGYGRFSGNLLVGNFGNGRINAFAATRDGWEARGHLKTTNHHPLVVDGLWGIGFGNDAAAGSSKVLYFAAGPDGENHGLFGSISFTP